MKKVFKDLMAMKVGELKEELEERGEAKSGNKGQGMAAPAAPFRNCARVYARSLQALYLSPNPTYIQQRKCLPCSRAQRVWHSPSRRHINHTSRSPMNQPQPQSHTTSRSPMNQPQPPSHRALCARIGASSGAHYYACLPGMHTM